LHTIGALLGTALRVDVKAGTEWKPLSRPGQVFDLQGADAVLAHKVQLERGSYTQVRLLVDPGKCSVELADGSHKPLVPHGRQDGVVVQLTEGPTDNLIHDLVLNLDAGRSVQAAGGSYRFAPLGSLNDRTALGELSGRLEDQGKRPLEGVTVMAQGGEGSQARTLVRSVRTGSDGTFRIGLIPINRMHYAVAQPRSGETLYHAQASPGFRLTRLAPRHTVEFPPFQVAPRGPAIEGTLGPEPDRVQVVELLQKLPSGDRELPFILRTLPGAATFHFDPVPAGDYEVSHGRAALGSQPQEVKRLPVKAPEGGPTVHVQF
jgi:hypothetical protein